jgi:hypothetical protein
MAMRGCHIAANTRVHAGCLYYNIPRAQVPRLLDPFVSRKRTRGITLGINTWPASHNGVQLKCANTTTTVEDENSMQIIPSASLSCGECSRSDSQPAVAAAAVVKWRRTWLHTWPVCACVYALKCKVHVWWNLGSLIHSLESGACTLSQFTCFWAGHWTRINAFYLAQLLSAVL